ncbi:MAG TPA: hypothetical protein VM100_06360 [Longimicrobiales bacterium]|nr:hypothetical protein [Longimicrobiales bacterium]
MSDFQPEALPPAPADQTRSARFLLLTSLQLERGAGEIHCRVQLAGPNKTYHGEAHELDSPSGRARAAARATLAAAEQVEGGINLGLEGVAIVDLFSRSYVVVSVEAVYNRQFALLAGIVTLETTRSVEDAAVLATLRAIDRWIAR